MDESVYGDLRNYYVGFYCNPHGGFLEREYKFEADFNKTEYMVYDIEDQEYSLSFADKNEIMAKLALKGVDEEKMKLIRNDRYETYKDMYTEVREAFESPLYVLLYVISMLAIMFHLWHGFKSACQSLGMNHPNINKIIEVKGKIIAVVIPMAFAFIPLYIYFTK